MVIGRLIDNREPVQSPCPVCFKIGPVWRDRVKANASEKLRLVRDQIADGPQPPIIPQTRTQLRREREATAITELAKTHIDLDRIAHIIGHIAPVGIATQFDNVSAAGR